MGQNLRRNCVALVSRSPLIRLSKNTCKAFLIIVQYDFNQLSSNFVRHNTKLFFQKRYYFSCKVSRNNYKCLCYLRTVDVSVFFAEHIHRGNFNQQSFRYNLISSLKMQKHVRVSWCDLFCKEWSLEGEYFFGDKLWVRSWI